MLINVVNVVLLMGLLAVEIILSDVITSSNFEDLTNLLSASNNSKLYVAGKNTLKMLNANLTLIKEIKTLEDDYNKILLIGGSENRLIACGTSSNTSCFIRDLNNLEILKSSQKSSLIIKSEQRNVVAVIGQQNKDIMFVGNYFERNFIDAAEYGVHPLFYNGIFAVSLNNFDFYACNESDSTFPKSCSSMPIDFSKNYEFDYIDGFIVQGFVYIFKIEKVGKMLQSVVARVCENDQNYFNSYFEMPIECDGLTKITAVTLLVADEKLSSRINSSTNEFIFMAAYEVPESSSSRLCPIRVPIISELFTLNKKRCFNTDLFLLPRSNGCLKEIPKDFCGGNMNSLRSTVTTDGNIKANSVIEVGFRITSLLGYNGENSSILFMGTSNGSVVKMDLTSKIFGMKYLYRGNSNPAKNLILSENSQYLFWRTTNLIYRSDVTDCNLFLSCDKCLDPLNPLCGWCSLESRCTRRLECFHHDLERRWIPSYGNSSHCPMLIMDFDLEVTMNTSLKIEIQNPPQLGKEESLECVFSTSNHSTPAFVSSSWISCDVPINLLSSDGFYDGKFILRIRGKNSYFLTNNFSAYRCSSMNTCDTCLTKKMCYFDIFSYSCKTDPSGKICPGIMDNFIRVSTGTNENVEIHLKDVQGLQLDNLTCWILDLNVSSPITKSGSNNFCGPFEFGTLKDHENLTIYVTFGANKRLNGSVTIEVYNCDVIGKDDCSLCKSREPKYGGYECIWCGRDCNFRNCQPNSKEEQCSYPSNIKVEPLIGPKEGGTRLTVQGKNLGSTADQVLVKIGDEPCKLLRNLYKPSRMYVCLTPASNKANPSAGIALQVTDIGENNSIETFHYKEVWVDKFYPLIGPQAGGTKITLTGDNLMMNPMTILNIITSKNDSLQINKDESNSSQVVFITPPGLPGTLLELTSLIIDGYTNNSLNQTFKYLNNPSVNNSNSLAMYKSAGCNLTIFGSNLNFSSTSFINATDCSSGIKHTTTIFQNLDKIQAMLPRFDCPEISATLHLDGWTQAMTIKMIEEPKFSIQNQENSLFIVAISGNDSSFSFLQSSSSIFLVSKLYPNVVDRIELKNEGASCTRLRALDNNIICEFVTNPGDYVQLTLCDLSYKLSLRKQNEFSAWQPALGVCIGVLLVVLVIVSAILLIKYFESKRKYKKLMMEINVMEQEARNQMKEAFAKLQTSEGGSQSEADEEVPFNPYRIYSYRILYPRERDDHVLHTKKRMEKYERKNQCLTQLLNSKFFFVNFVKVLEKQKDTNEKSKMGSYLSLFLLDKMDYAAQVITALLSDRIDSFLSSGKNLKLMMRSGETMVERIMSSWLSLTMYRHLTGNVGRSLLQLHLAIKKQAYSGPVDVCTNEARFTLSEGFFLKNYKFDESEIVMVATFDNSENHPTSCKLLACDAVSQAKEKIYDKYFQGVPFRLRLPVNKFNLVWRRGPEDLVMLHEEDDNNDLSMELVKVKTLKSYGVISGSHFILERRLAEAEESQVQLLGDETLALFNGSPSLYPITVKMPQRRYHLVDKAALENKAMKGKIFFTEMYYPLLQTKVALEDNINKLFSEILNVSDSLPPSVKFLFDFIDDSIQSKGINDQDIAKIWKRDSFMLRVWVNLLQNPYFLLDIPRNPVVDVNLAVIGQALVDSCSPQEKKLTKDSPTSTLLFAKNHKDYRPLVRDFYEKIQNQPRLPEARFMKIMESTYSRDVNFNVDFNLEMVLAELYEFAKSFKEEILVALDDDESSRNLRLVQKFQFLFNIE